MQIKITKLQTEVINIDLPLFVKYQENIIAVLTDNTAIKISQLPGLTMITTCKPNILYEFDKLPTFPVITQGEFNSAFNEAMAILINYNLPTPKVNLSTNDTSIIQL